MDESLLNFDLSSDASSEGGVIAFWINNQPPPQDLGSYFIENYFDNFMVVEDSYEQDEDMKTEKDEEVLSSEKNQDLKHKSKGKPKQIFGDREMLRILLPKFFSIQGVCSGVDSVVGWLCAENEDGGE